MAIIRELVVKNFRSIRELKWHPNPGLNCLIGPGDSGKSTILNAIDLVLGLRRNYLFVDSDFHNLNTDIPIEIYVTLGKLEDELKNIELYGHFLRGFCNRDKLITDEPVYNDNTETVLTIKLTVRDDLEVEYSLFSERADADGRERQLLRKHRDIVYAARLGTTNQYDMGWSKRSVLNKLSDNSLDVSSTLLSISRQARNIFAQQNIDNANDTLVKVEDIANKMGIPVGKLKALLDAKSASLSNGAIGLHDENNVPLRQLGTGSSRLLITGLQQAANNSSIFLIDEAEYGLEPYRITRLLVELGSKNDELGSKNENLDKQVFITTHSPYVLRELFAQQLNVVRNFILTESDEQNISHQLYNLEDNNGEQATLRACAEAFLAKIVIICEGKTEIGLLRGFDLYVLDKKKSSLQELGVYYADGGGDSMFERAKIFAQLGYPTAIFKDSDKDVEHTIHCQNAIDSGIKVFEWGNNQATENALFVSCPDSCILSLLNFAIERKGVEAIAQNILNSSCEQFSLDDCKSNFNEGMRHPLGVAAKKGGWFKDIEPAEHIARTIIGPNSPSFASGFRSVINEIRNWARLIHEERFQ